MKYYVFDGSYVMLEIVEATYLNEANEETKFNAIDFSIYALQHVYTRYTPYDLRTYYSVESIIDGLNCLMEVIIYSICMILISHHLNYIFKEKFLYKKF